MLGIFFTFERENLRGAGLAPAYVLGVLESRGARTFFVDADEGVFDRRKILGLDAEIRRGIARDLAHFSGFQALDRFDEMRRVADPIVCDHRDCMRELNRRERVVALADAGRNRIAQIPLAMFFAKILAREALAFPFA